MAHSANHDLARVLADQAERLGTKPALLKHGGAPEELSYAELDDASARLATGLEGLGLNAGDRVAILSESRPRWGTVFFATLRAGGIAVPLDHRLSEHDLGRILDDAAPRILFVSQSAEALAEAVLHGREDLLVFSLETIDANPRYESFDRIAGHSAPINASRSADDVAVLTYTSGTMGHSKGVCTTWRNLRFEIEAISAVMANDERVATVSILPLSHLFELSAGFLAVLHGGGSICYCDSLLPQEIAAAMQKQRPTCMTSVPLVLKLLAGGIRREVAKLPRGRQLLFNALRGISQYLPLPLRRLAFQNLIARFGGRLEYFVCGGAPLDAATRRFFESIGIPVYEGYGLAETSPVIATNGPASHCAGSVGQPLPGVEIRIADNGEILTRGPQVMRGYFHNPDLTAEVIDPDGWLHTGDLGYVDQRGFLHVSGRQKNTIVLASGKKVQPEELEATLFEHPFIAEGCVIGVPATEGLAKGTEEVCAIAVATDAAVDYCKARRLILEDLVAEVIGQRARRFSPGERPTQVVLRDRPLPRTSTRKLRRPDISQWITSEVH